jgi:hypothetical protein
MRRCWIVVILLLGCHAILPLAQPKWASDTGNFDSPDALAPDAATADAPVAPALDSTAADAPVAPDTGPDAPVAPDQGKPDSFVPQQEICGNGIDDDGDGALDCADADCSSYPGCAGSCNLWTDGWTCSLTADGCLATCGAATISCVNGTCQCQPLASGPSYICPNVPPKTGCALCQAALDVGCCGW